MRPVLEGLIRYESLLDGALGLWDLAELNEALDAKFENQRRIDEALREKR